MPSRTVIVIDPDCVNPTCEECDKKLKKIHKIKTDSGLQQLYYCSNDMCMKYMI